jgi:hypothetical protein
MRRADYAAALAELELALAARATRSLAARRLGHFAADQLRWLSGTRGTGVGQSACASPNPFGPEMKTKPPLP